MDRRFNTLINNTIIFGIGNLLVKLVSFFLMPLYTITLTLSEYGEAELLNSTIEIVLPLATLCIVDAVYRFSIDDTYNIGKIVTNAFFVIVSSNCIVLFVTIILSFFVDYEYATYFFLLHLGLSFYNLTVQLARGLGKSRLFAFCGVVNTIVLFMLSYLLLYQFKLGIKGYFLSYIGGYTISGLLAYMIASEHQYISLKNIDLNFTKSMLTYSLPNIPNMISWWINTVFSRYIILMHCGVDMAGVYIAASKIPAMINVFTTIFQQAWQYSTSKEISRLNNVYFFSKVFSVFSYLVFLITAVILILNKNVCFVLLKESFYEARLYVPLLLLAAFHGCIATFFGTFYNALKNNKMLMCSTIIGAIVNLLGNFMVVPYYGIFGSACVMTISYFIIMLVRVHDITRKIDIKINWKRYIYQTFLLLVLVLLTVMEKDSLIWVNFICLAMIFLSDIKSLKAIINYVINFERIIWRSL